MSLRWIRQTGARGEAKISMPPFVPFFAALIFVAGCSVRSGPASLEDPLVVAGGEPLRGTRLASGVVAYRGIPYAAPPTGPLRWRSPRPHVARQGVHGASGFGQGRPTAGLRLLRARRPGCRAPMGKAEHCRLRGRSRERHGLWRVGRRNSTDVDAASAAAGGLPTRSAKLRIGPGRNEYEPDRRENLDAVPFTLWHDEGITGIDRNG